MDLASGKKQTLGISKGKQRSKTNTTTDVSSSPKLPPPLSSVINALDLVCC